MPTTEDLDYLSQLITTKRPTNTLIKGNAMQKIDYENDNDWKTVKALVYGRPGSGKTNFGVSAPRPLILLSELQAKRHIVQAAKRMGRPRPDTLAMATLDDYRAVAAAFHGDRAKPFQVIEKTTGKVVLTMDPWPESLVVDSLTDACDIVVEEIRRQSPQKTGRDGLPVDSERFWNVLEDRASKLIRAFRDVPAHVVFLCLLKDKETGEGDEKSRVVGPQLPMVKLANAVMAAVNVVGVTYRRRAALAVPVLDEDGKPLVNDGKPVMERPMVYGIGTTGPDYMDLKPYPPLRPHEVTDFSSWVQRVNGEDDGTTAPPPMDAEAVLTE